MTARRFRKIGVIGGMGPEATLLFMQRVLDATPARDDGDHIPMLIDNNPQIPSRIRALIDGTGEDPAPVLAAMARGLSDAGAEALVMPCNTAHNYTDAIRAAVSIPFLSMVDLTAAAFARALQPGAKVGILASPAIAMTGLYDRALSAIGLTTLYPGDQGAMLQAIRALKISADDAGAHDTVIAGAQDLIDQGADMLLVGCSEFSLISDSIAALHPTIDSLNVLVDHAIAFSTDAAPARRDDVVPAAAAGGHGETRHGLA